MKKSYNAPEIIVEQMESLCAGPEIGFGTGSVDTMGAKQSSDAYFDEEDDWDEGENY